MRSLSQTKITRRLAVLATTAALTIASAGNAFAQQCGNDAAGFPAWSNAFKAKAAAQGISAATANAALSAVA